MVQNTDKQNSETFTFRKTLLKKTEGYFEVETRELVQKALYLYEFLDTNGNIVATGQNWSEERESHRFIFS